jgi:hypothetical protein
LLCALVARVGSLDVPHIGFQDISSASNAHLREVSDCVLRLDIA